MNVMVRELSLGERMKMELISALIHEPRVLFLDEPTIGLDVVSQKRVREFLRVYNSEHKIVTMLTSHYMQDIEELCDRVIIIDHGKIFFDGPLDDIIDRFSGYKIVSLTFRGCRRRAIFAEFGEVIEQTPVSVQLKVPRAKVTETARQLLDNCKVTDINVQELPVEEVIRQLFGERTVAQPGGRGGSERGCCDLTTEERGLEFVRVGRIELERCHRHFRHLHFFGVGNALDETGRDQAVERVGHVLRLHAGVILDLGPEHRFGESNRAHHGGFATGQLDIAHPFFPSSFHTDARRQDALRSSQSRTSG